MRAQQHVSARRRGPLAVSTAYYGRGARFAVLKTPEGTILVSQSPRIRGMSA